jgi:8-oxo-dGTP pyrophosphatase MutT (NUDIX family)
MTIDQPAPVVPALAATILLVRDGAEGLEVLMMERHSKASFASGATAFPGGRVEASDKLLIPHCPPAAGADLPPRIAAIREAYEECRVLLARPAAGAEILSAAGVDAFAKAHDRAGDFLGAVVAERLMLATDLLFPFAHWITPALSPKRFDTYFFLAVAPEGQAPRHDGNEAVDALWMTPPRALAESAAGQRQVLFVTHVMLHQLIKATSTREAVTIARARPIVTVTPDVVEGPDGVSFHLPAEAGFDIAGIPRAVTKPRQSP